MHGSNPLPYNLFGFPLSGSSIEKMRKNQRAEKGEETAYMKKKVSALALAVALAAILVAGASLAYFTSMDNKTNTFAVGGVKIELIEQQRNADGTALEDFEQGKILMPLVGSAQGEKDQFGQPVAKNYVDKIVTVKNIGRSDAYIRAYFAIPSALNDGYETFNAGQNLLHFDFGNKDGVTTHQNQWLWMNESGTWKYFETVIGDVNYNVYYADYYTTLAPDATTEQFVSGVYLDKDIDFVTVDGEDLMAYKGEPLAVQPDPGNISCPVFAVAVQADGFASAEEAITAAFGANYNPWGGTMTNLQK